MPRRLTSLWAAAAALAVLVGALLPLLGDGRFYFADDTQAGAYGIWYELGERLRAGTLPLLEVSTWQAGNVLAEGQWGVGRGVAAGAAHVGDRVALEQHRAGGRARAARDAARNAPRGRRAACDGGERGAQRAGLCVLGSRCQAERPSGS